MKTKTRPASEFAEIFLERGYRETEHLFGYNRAVENRFRAICGGEELKAERREARRAK